MKNIKKVIIIAALVLFISTGCTKSFKDEDTKNVYTENILCKPTDQETIDIYKKNNKEIDNLVDCNSLKVDSGGYEGLWTNIFVKPLAYVIVKFGHLLKNYGYSIMLLGVLLRLLVLPLSKKTMDMSENMKKANPELQSLEKKYAGRNDQESMMKK